MCGRYSRREPNFVEACTDSTAATQWLSLFTWQLHRQESVTFSRFCRVLLREWDSRVSQGCGSVSGPRNSELTSWLSLQSRAWRSHQPHHHVRKSCGGTRSARACGGGCGRGTRGVSPILSAHGRKLWNPHCVSPCSLCNSTGRNRLLFRGITALY